ncbi:MAG: dihydrofolate reductase [Zavarzinella sp.]
MPTSITLIAACTRTCIIGNAAGIPWRLRNDLQRFRRLTMGHAMLMGRTTAEHIGKPLDGRRNIVLTRQTNWNAAGFEIVHTLDQALEKTRDCPNLMVIGGGQIYDLCYPQADEIFLTIVDVEVDPKLPGTAYFPRQFVRDRTQWQAVARETILPDEKNAIASEFWHFRRTVEGAEDMKEPSLFPTLACES